MVEEQKESLSAFHHLFFTIDEVVAESRETYITPSSEVVMGGRSDTYGGGFTMSLTFKVTPDDETVPVRTLYFRGFSALEAGDYVTAKIARKIMETNVEFLSIPSNAMGFPTQKPLSYEMELSLEERAIELKKISKPDGKVLRIEKSVDYK